MIVVIAPVKIGHLIKKKFERDIQCIEMPEINGVLKALRKHTDMGIHWVHDSLVIEPSIFEEMKLRLSAIGISEKRLKCGNQHLSEQYPEDIAYNCVALGNHFFYHPRTDSNIVGSYQRAGVEMHPVKQGYTKCSTLIVGKNAVITEDLNLYRTFEKANIKTLLIAKGEILLKGFEYGFIGGAGGLYGRKLFLNGSLKHHSQRLEIEKFIKAQGTQIIELHQGQLEDCGSIFILDF